MSLHFSILTSKLSFSVFFKHIVFSILIFLSIILSINLFCDPYWTIRDKAFYGSSHNCLSTKQRFVKALQIVFRQPEIIIIGSSRVYRGFNFEDLPYHKKEIFYNAGISSLTLTEALGYVKQSSRFTRVKHIILGLDLWMMDKNKLFHEGFNEHLGEFQDLCNSFFISLLSFEALEDSFDEFKSLFSLPKKEGGFWEKNGFFKTIPLEKKEIDSFLKSYENNLQSIVIDLKQFSILEKIIFICREKNIKLSIYVSPLHEKIFHIYEKAKLGTIYQEWVERIKNLCDSNDVRFFNFLKDYFDQSPDLPGSPNIWIDYSHFSPIVGRIILKKILEEQDTKEKHEYEL
jgi:hypothetical protein